MASYVLLVLLALVGVSSPTALIRPRDTTCGSTSTIALGYYKTQTYDQSGGTSYSNTGYASSANSLAFCSNTCKSDSQCKSFGITTGTWSTTCYYYASTGYVFCFPVRVIPILTTTIQIL